MSDFKTIHNLPFEVADWEYNGLGPEFFRFRIGTCEGVWRSTQTSYDILAVTNDNPGNGHFEDVLQWFYHSCIRDRKKLIILEVWNKRLKKHLIEKRGFLHNGIDNVELPYKKIKKTLRVTKPNQSIKI